MNNVLEDITLQFSDNIPVHDYTQSSSDNSLPSAVNQSNILSDTSLSTTTLACDHPSILDTSSSLHISQADNTDGTLIPYNRNTKNHQDKKAFIKQRLQLQQNEFNAAFDSYVESSKKRKGFNDTEEDQTDFSMPLKKQSLLGTVTQRIKCDAFKYQFDSSNDDSVLNNITNKVKPKSAFFSKKTINITMGKFDRALESTEDENDLTENIENHSNDIKTNVDLETSEPGPIPNLSLVPKLVNYSDSEKSQENSKNEIVVENVNSNNSLSTLTSSTSENSDRTDYSADCSSMNSKDSTVEISSVDDTLKSSLTLSIHLENSASLDSSAGLDIDPSDPVPEPCMEISSMNPPSSNSLSLNSTGTPALVMLVTSEDIAPNSMKMSLSSPLPNSEILKSSKDIHVSSADTTLKSVVEEGLSTSMTNLVENLCEDVPISSVKPNLLENLCDDVPISSVEPNLLKNFCEDIYISYVETSKQAVELNPPTPLPNSDHRNSTENICADTKSTNAGSKFSMMLSLPSENSLTTPKSIHQNSSNIFKKSMRLSLSDISSINGPCLTSTRYSHILREFSNSNSNDTTTSTAPGSINENVEIEDNRDVENSTQAPSIADEGGKLCKSTSGVNGEKNEKSLERYSESSISGVGMIEGSSEVTLIRDIDNYNRFSANSNDTEKTISNNTEVTYVLSEKEKSMENDKKSFPSVISSISGFDTIEGNSEVTLIGRINDYCRFSASTNNSEKTKESIESSSALSLDASCNMGSENATSEMEDKEGEGENESENNTEDISDDSPIGGPKKDDGYVTQSADTNDATEGTSDRIYRVTDESEKDGDGSNMNDVNDGVGNRTFGLVDDSKKNGDGSNMNDVIDGISGDRTHDVKSDGEVMEDSNEISERINKSIEVGEDGNQTGVNMTEDTRGNSDLNLCTEDDIEREYISTASDIPGLTCNDEISKKGCDFSKSAISAIVPCNSWNGTRILRSHSKSQSTSLSLVTKVFKKDKDKKNKTTKKIFAEKVKKIKANIHDTDLYTYCGRDIRKPVFPEYDFWCNPRLYNYLIGFLKPKHGIKTNKKVVNLVKNIYENVEEAMSKTAGYQKNVKMVKKLLWENNVISTTMDFFDFVNNYTPVQFQVRARPSICGPCKFEFNVKDVFKKLNEDSF